MFAPAAPSSPPSLTRPPRSGPLQRLNQLRSFTQSHLASHPSSGGQRSYRNSLSRAVSLHPTLYSGGGGGSGSSSGSSSESSASPSLPANEGTDRSETQAPCPEGVSDYPVASSTPSRERRAGNGGKGRMPSAVADGLLSAIPDSRNGATSSRPEGQSEATANRSRDGFDPAGPRNNAGGRFGRKQRATIRFYAYQDPSRPSLPFSPVARILPSEDSIIRVGRYSERDGVPTVDSTEPSDAPVGFKSKVVSRKHCEFSFANGQWHVKDVGSSSGTFLNHMRLSQPNIKSRLYAVRDGDIVQLGIDFKGGEEMIFRCVRIRIECNRSWQQLPNEFK